MNLPVKTNTQSVPFDQPIVKPREKVGKIGGKKRQMAMSSPSASWNVYSWSRLFKGWITLSTG